MLSAALTKFKRLIISIIWHIWAGIEAIHAAGMLSVEINVTVTTVKPDIPLKSTGELDFEKINSLIN